MNNIIIKQGYLLSLQRLISFSEHKIFCFAKVGQGFCNLDRNFSQRPGSKHWLRLMLDSNYLALSAAKVRTFKQAVVNLAEKYFLLITN